MERKTVYQEWEVEDNTVFLFDRTQKYPMKKEGNLLLFSESNDQYTFYMELFPGENHEGFRGYWYLDYPGLMLTASNVEGKLK